MFINLEVAGSKILRCVRKPCTKRSDILFYRGKVKAMGGGMGEDRVVHRVLVGKPEEKRPLGRPRRRWEHNIKMDLQEVGGVRGD